MIITRTPYRVSFFGGGTDYPDWFRDNGGAVLAAALDKYCYLSCRYLPPFFNESFRIVYNRIELASAVDQIEHPAVRACVQHCGIADGLEIIHNGDLPARTGLGSSSSFTVGLLNALRGLTSRLMSSRELAEESIHLEQNVMKEAVGCQDQVMAAFGGLNLVTFGAEGFEVKPLPVAQAKLTDLQNHLMLVYTGVSRYSSVVAAEIIRSIPSRQHELMMLRRLVDDGVQILCNGRDITDFGRLLHEAWLIKRSLAQGVATDVIDRIYETARANGALGGKVIGAGGGGFVLIFAAPEAQEKIREKLQGLIFVPVRFQFGGTQIIFYQPPDPAMGAP